MEKELMTEEKAKQIRERFGREYVTLRNIDLSGIRGCGIGYKIRKGGGTYLLNVFVKREDSPIVESLWKIGMKYEELPIEIIVTGDIVAAEV